MSREQRLKEKLENIKNKFDYIFIDCPPSLGLITLNAFTASDSVLIPVQCEYYALEGLGQLINTIDLVKKHLNKNIEIEGALLTMYDARTNLSNQVVKEVKKYFNNKKCCERNRNILPTALFYDCCKKYIWKNYFMFSQKISSMEALRGTSSLRRVPSRAAKTSRTL